MFKLSKASIASCLLLNIFPLVNEFNNHKSDYEDIKDAIELQFENIEKRFLDFESAMEKNEYDEVAHIVKALDSMIDHMSNVVLDVPNIVLLSHI